MGGEDDVSKESRISPFRIASFVTYNPDTGVIRWSEPEASMFSSDHAHKVFSAQRSGKLAFNTSRGRGYLCGQFDGIILQAHRVAWCVYHGEWPEYHLDHINRDRSDNRIANLRVCDYHENNQNRGMLSNNRSGYKGVSWNRRTGSWRVSIRFNGERITMEGFSCPLKAAEAYDALALDLHGEFATTNNKLGLM